LYRPLAEAPGAHVIGFAQAHFSVPVTRGRSTDYARISVLAHAALLEAARRTHSGHIDIVDVAWAPVPDPNAMLRQAGIFASIVEGAVGIIEGGDTGMAMTANAVGNIAVHAAHGAPQMVVYSTTGRVVRFDGGIDRIAAADVEAALERAVSDVVASFEAGARIAIVSMSAEDRGIMDFIAGELEHILQRRGFVIVDRSELDAIRIEQQLGLTGEVSDSTAVRIGHLVGASIVMTGGVDGVGDLRRLRLRALDTTTAQVIRTASEAF